MFIPHSGDLINLHVPVDLRVGHSDPPPPTNRFSEFWGEGAHKGGAGKGREDMAEIREKESKQLSLKSILSKWDSFIFF